MSAEPPLGVGISTEVWREGRQWAMNYAREQGFPEAGWLEQTMRWSDQDPYRHLNNARYSNFLEAGRMHLIDHVRNNLTEDRDRRQQMVIAKLTINFLRPATAPDVLLICTRVSSATNKRFELDCLMISYKTKQVVASAYSDMRGFDLKAQRGAPYSDDFKRVLGDLMAPSPQRAKL